MKVKAPKGYHFMKGPKGKVALMKHTGKFKKHAGSSLTMNLPVAKTHTRKK